MANKNKDALKSVVQDFTTKMNNAVKGDNASAGIKNAVQEMLNEFKKMYPVPEAPKKN